MNESDGKGKRKIKMLLKRKNVTEQVNLLIKTFKYNNI